MTTPPGLTDADRADLHARLVSWFGDDRQAFLVSHLAPLVDRIKADGYLAGLAAGVEVRASEFQQTALEMARKADQAERRAEEAEFHVEQLRDARDSAERRLAWVKVAEGQQGAGDDTWKVAVYQETAQARCEWCGQASGHENGCRLGLGPDERGAHRTDCNCAPPYADCRHPACDCTDCVYDCPGSCGDHQWLDRPESDTRECLICGTEVAG